MSEAVALDLRVADAPAIALRVSGETMNRYKPGATARFTIEAVVDGVLTDEALVATVAFPDGTIATPTVVHDAAGEYHVDVAVPNPMRAGIGVFRLQATGAPTALVERRFEVERLLF